jgi:hypothetical protein
MADRQPPPTRQADDEGYEHRRATDPAGPPIAHRREGDADWWAKLPGIIKIFIALGSVWIAGWTSALVAERFSHVPQVVEQHERRLLDLERHTINEADRTNRHLLFLSCRIEDMSENVAAQQSRCDLVLDGPARAVLDGLRNAQRRPGR